MHIVWFLEGDAEDQFNIAHEQQKLYLEKMWQIMRDFGNYNAGNGKWRGHKEHDDFKFNYGDGHSIKAFSNRRVVCKRGAFDVSTAQGGSQGREMKYYWSNEGKLRRAHRVELEWEGSDHSGQKTSVSMGARIVGSAFD